MLAIEMMRADFHPSALTDIYQDHVSMAIWKRQPDAKLTSYAQALLDTTRCFQTRFVQSPLRVSEQLQQDLPLHKHRRSFIDDVTQLVDMFSCLFDLESVGVRMAVLNTAMCPKFHVDRVPCRLICTYAGVGTQWHAHEQVRRFDDGSLAQIADDLPHQLNTNDVALLKGESWEGNEGRGLVHRSPSASDTNRRLVLTLDFA